MQEYWFPWFPSRYNADTMHLSPLEDGIYRRLIDHYMLTKTALPENDAALARIVGMPIAEFKQTSSTVMVLFKVRSGFYYHKKCDEILSDQNERSKERSERASKAAKAKAEKYSKFNADSATSRPQADLKDANALPNPATEQNITEHNRTVDTKVSIIVPDDVSTEVWSDFITHRKAKKSPVTKTALDGIRREAIKAGISLQDAIVTIVNRGWTGFKAEWMNNGTGQRQNSAVTIGNGSAAREPSGNGFGGRKSQTELARDITEQIKRDRLANWEANQGKPTPPESVIGTIDPDLHDVEEIR